MKLAYTMSYFGIFTDRLSISARDSQPFNPVAMASQWADAFAQINNLFDNSGETSTPQ
jgi:hypothetical protein